MPFTINDVGPRATKDGPIDWSIEEKQAIVAEWNRNEAERIAEAAKPTPPTVEELINALRKAVRGDMTDLDALDARR